MAQRKPDVPLKKGWTTGACAAAGARAAWRFLLTGERQESVRVSLPKGVSPEFTLSRLERTGDAVTAGIIKDAGDDPDVTHGAEIITTVRAGAPGSGITFAAGEGVGHVTLPGLPLAVGEPAINPKPREIIAANLAEVAEELDAVCDLHVTVSIPGGEALAVNTANGRLGILGGLSILGTTGVVVPYSCASWIHSIHRGIDVARAAGIDHIAGSTGRTSEETVRNLFGLQEQALIDMGDFAGGMLKYLRRKPIPKLTIAGGFGKLAKLADGEMDLHSSRSRVNTAMLARWLAEAGADKPMVEAAAACTAAAQVLALAEGYQPMLAERCARGAREVALAALSGDVAVDVLVIDRGGNQLAHVG